MSAPVLPDVAGIRARAAALGRELVLLCDAAGVVTWMDERAARVLGAHAAGAPLGSLAAPGGEEKIARFLQLAGHGSPGADWELMLRDAAGAPIALATRAAPLDGGTLLVGSLVSHDYDALMTRMSGAMGEMGALHRQTERQRDELARLNAQLTDSGRGIAALYAELEEKSDSLRIVGEVRSRFVGNASHELRTPIASILGLAKLLLGRIDGDLTDEQEKQIDFIRKSAEVLRELVDDMLDLSKIEAGKLVLRPSTFEVEELFATLRGMLRPLAVNDRVRLVFEGGDGFPTLRSDEGKVSQVLRNFVSNALKFTEQGEVRVWACDNADGTITFSVSDTGVGIAPEHLERIFEEFVQVDNPLQARAKGTGLGLAVSRRIAELLEGRIVVRSTPGAGSTFSLTIPVSHSELAELSRMEARQADPDPMRAPILVVEDDHQNIFLYEKFLSGSGFEVIPARTVDDARRTLRTLRPAAVVLDVMLDGELSWRFLEEMKSDPETCDIPVLVVTVMDREKKARALGADEFFVKPMDREWLLRKLRTLGTLAPMERVLVIDDDEVARYLVRRLLADTRYAFSEAADAPEGIRLARELRPDVIFLDFVLPSATAFEVLDELKGDPRTRNIPVIISTSKELGEGERERLKADTAAIVPKDRLSREVAITRIREALSKAHGAGSVVAAGRRGESAAQER
jgi:signal transduction histidine kinase/CheY-like chemotaxis protein